MDSSMLTHVAAIVVGVGLTLLIINSLKGKESPAVVPASTSKSAAKKKKKKKSKASAASKAVDTETKDESQEKSIPAPVKEEKEPVAAPETSKGKKKKKKKKAETTKPDGGSSAKESNQTIEAKTVVPQKPPPQQPQPVAAPQWESRNARGNQPQEDEWIVEKPKKRKQKPKVPKTTASAPAVASNESVTLDAKKIGIIIGPKGATMKAIEEATGCKLDVNAPSRDEPTKGNKPQKATVILSGGDKQSMTKARKAINELADKGYCTLLQSGDFGEISITVHPRCLSEIVGPGGRTIQALQSALDVKLTIPPTDWKPNAVQLGKIKPAKVGIAGSKDNSKKAKAAIESLLEWHHHEITHPGFVHELVHVPHEFYHSIIGVRGGEIKHIKGNYKVEVYMPNDDSVTEDVVVVGKRANVEKAILYILAVMDRDTEQREQKYSDDNY